MTESVFPRGAATGVGSVPGTDPGEAAAMVAAETPRFPYLPELPERGTGADPLGRTAGLLVDLAVEEVPSGYRVVDRPGRDHQRAVDLLRWDIDALTHALGQSSPPVVKTQCTGPWTLVAGIELARGQRVLTDPGAVRDFVDSLVEGLSRHVADLAHRSGAQVIVQLDEPWIPDVLAGSLPTASGYETVAAVPEPEARNLLATVVGDVESLTGMPVVVHCCAPRPPVALLRSAGAGAIALDATLLDGAPGSLLDEIGEAWQSGSTLFLGLVPSVEPRPRPSLEDLAGPAFRLADRLGFARSVLVDYAVPTPVCGLAAASRDWSRRALSLARDLGKSFTEPPESWS